MYIFYPSEQEYVQVAYRKVTVHFPTKSITSKNFQRADLYKIRASKSNGDIISGLGGLLAAEIDPRHYQPQKQRL
jgi:hypothetical protein